MPQHLFTGHRIETGVRLPSRSFHRQHGRVQKGYRREFWSTRVGKNFHLKLGH